MLTDLHVHLRPDGPDTPAERYFTAANAQRYREVATERGITDLGVSEHVYRFTRALEVWDHEYWRESARDDLDAYARFVREDTDLLLGIEADFIPGREDRMAALLEEHEWDYVIGSVHFLGDRAVDYDKYDVWTSGRSADEVWRTYFTWLGEAAACGLFDLLAHPDLVKVWGAGRPVPEKDPRFYYDLAMEKIADSGIAVEISTAGLRKPVAEVYPAAALLEMLVDAGNPLVLSSDAHVPEHLGHGYEDALAWLADHGVHDLATFRRREVRVEAIAS
ncbi:MAG TPA: histidinol-phosphatase [Baekduia sp.]|nr:histidinol-phosphatase [Baekduia sp.]